MYRSMLRIANTLDRLGLYKEADFLTHLMTRMADAPLNIDDLDIVEEEETPDDTEDAVFNANLRRGVSEALKLSEDGYTLDFIRHPELLGLYPDNSEIFTLLSQVLPKANLKEQTIWYGPYKAIVRQANLFNKAAKRSIFLDDATADVNAQGFDKFLKGPVFHEQSANPRQRATLDVMHASSNPPAEGVNPLLPKTIVVDKTLREQVKEELARLKKRREEVRELKNQSPITESQMQGSYFESFYKEMFDYLRKNHSEIIDQKMADLLEEFSVLGNKISESEIRDFALADLVFRGFSMKDPATQKITKVPFSGLRKMYYADMMAAKQTPMPKDEMGNRTKREYYKFNKR